MTAKAVTTPHPIIIVTGAEELQLPDWVRKVEEDTASPVGTLELEIIEFLESDETLISSEDLRRYAKSKQADFGLRHAQAFLAKYREEGFGFPAGTRIAFPGTVVVDEDDLRCIPFLLWVGFEWQLRRLLLLYGRQGRVHLVRLHTSA